MFCTQCGSDITDGAIACPGCGTRLASQSPANPVGTAGPAASHAGQVSSPAFRLDPHRWTNGDRITGTATVLLLVSLFLPWYGVNFLGISAQADGLAGHGYLYIVLLLGLAILAYLGLQAGSEEMPAWLPLAHEQRLFAAVGLNAVLVLLAFLIRPDGTGWRFGAFTGIVAALTAAAPLVIPVVRARRARV